MNTAKKGFVLYVPVGRDRDAIWATFKRIRVPLIQTSSGVMQRRWYRYWRHVSTDSDEFKVKSKVMQGQTLVVLGHGSVLITWSRESGQLITSWCVWIFYAGRVDLLSLWKTHCLLSRDCVTRDISSLWDQRIISAVLKNGRYDPLIPKGVSQVSSVI